MPDTPSVQRRTIATLSATQVLGAVGVSSGIAVGSLLAADLSGSEQWAGLSGTFQVLGGALAAIVLARVMAARGRRPGLALGYGTAITGALLVLAAAIVGSFPLLLLGSLLFGGATASNSQARFAATDLADDHHRGRHLSLVVWATTVGAVAGPNLTGPGAAVARAVGVPALAGPFVFSLVGFLLAGAVLLVALRPDPLLLARARHTDHDEPGRTEGGVGDGIRALRAHPVAASGLLAMATGHAVMVGVMVMTPLHMRHGHAALDLIGLTISLHVLGMYALSPVTGWLVDRYGGRPVAAGGAGILVLAGLVAALSAEGASLSLTAGLVLLGLGWSGTMVAGSTLLTAALPLRERPAAQGVADVAMGLAGGGAGALAGVVVHAYGFPALAVAAAALAGLLAVALLAFRT